MAQTTDFINLFIGAEAVVQRCSVNKKFLKILQNSQEKTCARVSFLIKSGRQLYEKWDSGIGVFLWILRDFKNNTFLADQLWTTTFEF